MANIIKIKRSAVPAKVPATTDIDLGELAVNTYDGKLFLKKNDGTESVVEIGGLGATGYTGSQGIQGDIGYTGSQGIQGDIGYTGSASTVVGYTGSQGIQGDIGYTGSASTVVGYTGSAADGASVTTSTTPPATPTDGDLWWDETDGQLKIYYNDGTSSQWVDASAAPVGYTGSQGIIGYTGSIGADGAIGYTGSAAEGASVTISDGSPINPSNGDMWWDASIGRLFIFYADGTSSQWVDASPSIVGPAGADGIDGINGINGIDGATYGPSDNLQINSLGVGTAFSGVTGEIRASSNITAFYSSDMRLKDNIKPIENALIKLDKINGMSFDWTDEEIAKRGGVDDYFVRKSDIGVIAQEIEAVLPEAVATRQDGYKAVRYELIVPLLIQAIKEQQEQIQEIKMKIEGVK